MHFERENLLDHHAESYPAAKLRPMKLLQNLINICWTSWCPTTPASNTERHLSAHYVVKLARLGGDPDRTHDPPPGNTVIWRGMSRLTDIELGIMIGVQLVGN